MSHVFFSLLISIQQNQNNQKIPVTAKWNREHAFVQNAAPNSEKFETRHTSNGWKPRHSVKTMHFVTK